MKDSVSLATPLHDRIIAYVHHLIEICIKTFGGKRISQIVYCINVLSHSATTIIKNIFFIVVQVNNYIFKSLSYIQTFIYSYVQELFSAFVQLYNNEYTNNLYGIKVNVDNYYNIFRTKSLYIYMHGFKLIVKTEIFLSIRYIWLKLRIVSKYTKI